MGVAGRKQIVAQPGGLNVGLCPASGFWYAVALGMIDANVQLCNVNPL